VIWAQVKQQVASQYTLNRTIEQTRAQTDDAFSSITSARICKCIEHCHKWIDAFLKTEEAGSLKQYETLTSLVDKLDLNATMPSDVENIVVVEEQTEPEQLSEPSTA
jgi:hypothetical protein